MNAAASRALRDLAEAMRLLYERGLINIRGGNGSVRIGNYMWITPSGVAKHSLKPEDMVPVNIETGKPLRGHPSIEYRMHLEIYRRVSGASAVLHAHNPLVIAALLHGLSLNPSMSIEARYSVGSCIGVVKPLEPGSLELAESVAREASRCRVVVLERHGAVAWGGNVYEALDALEGLEDLARISIIGAVLGRK